MKRKITITTGTRADYGILRPILKEILKSKKLQLYLIVTGTHLSRKYGMTINEIKNDGFKIYRTIDMIPQGDTVYHMSITLGKGIIGFSKLFNKIKPDINLILGDRDEMLASSLAACHMNIPNAHIHGGDKSGGIDEYNRHAITKISNIHFVATVKSKQRVIKLGEDPKYVFLTGSPSIDEIAHNDITDATELKIKYDLALDKNEILLIQHPVTTEFEKSQKQITNTLNAIVKTQKTTIAILPNSDAGNMKIIKQLKLYAKKYSFIKLFPNLPRSDYLGLLKNCGALVGNSSSGIVEASYFHIPVVNIGMRQKNRDRGKNIIDVEDGSTEKIYYAILHALSTRQISSKKNIYGDGTASKKIVQYLEILKLDKKLIQKQIRY